MNVKLVSVTKPLVEGLNTAEELIVYIARVSSPSNQLNMETAPKLLKYCIDHKHWSIFEQADMTVEVETSRGISAQLLRHKSMFVQEFSQRYQTVTDFELYEPRRQDTKNRQNSFDDLDPKIQDWYLNALIGVNTTAKALYEEALRLGVAKESARFLLPLTTKTKLYLKNSVRGWIHYLEVRTDKATQLEHREIAEEIKKIFIEQFPVISEALEWKKN